MKYKNYLTSKIEDKEAPQPYYPPFFPRIRISRTGYRRCIRALMLTPLGYWFKLYKIEIYWSVPKRAKYVERYHLEFLATFIGQAKIRTLHCIDIHPFSVVRPFFRHSSQEKIRPVEGTWTDKLYGT